MTILKTVDTEKLHMGERDSKPREGSEETGILIKSSE
jgi:hypothetical protein